MSVVVRGKAKPVYDAARINVAQALGRIPSWPELLTAALASLGSSFGHEFANKLRPVLGVEQLNAIDVLAYAVFLANMAIDDEEMRERLLVYHKARTEGRP